MTFVYAKCSSLDRLELWDNLYYLAADMELPWVIGGDFNVVLHEDEKIGGLLVYPPEVEDFSFFVNSCGLFDTDYKGSPFTWWNRRSNEECIFNRLDKIFVNQPFQILFPNIEAEHLIRTGSDHAPLLMNCREEAQQSVKPFKFLNFWTTHTTFTDVVKQNWVADFVRDPFLMFKQKLKRVKTALSHWSKLTFGDIFKQLAIREDIVRIKEMLFEEELTIENRIVLQQAQVELKKYLSFEEQFWKQKASMTWFAEVDFFHKHFTQEGELASFELLNNVPTMVTMEQNMELCRFPTIKEVNGAVFALGGESASGPDGFTGLFYQSCWDIVGEDIFNMLQQFYVGASLPKSITHTNLVLLPKKPQVQTFYDLRPISLSNFINKVIFRVLHDRLETILPSLISSNQSGFVKGRSIFENILLTHEIITDIRLRWKPANVVIKIDMAKAYDMGVTHLAYADDTIIFTSADIYSLNKIVEDKYFKVLVQSLDFKEILLEYKRIGQEQTLDKMAESLPFKGGGGNWFQILV
uniref:Reverse transcriptase domain-containing protein n=1 Tax=Nicotiana tabacum TaxID=4097 RepID=A0A1S4A5T0_TOBAC|nr:PREDICTED: uncharacterized protein LOC107794026 [Nicotiana tabacum]